MLREFMSQSASRCLLCLARGWVIIHTNGRPDKTELGESNPPSCVSRGAVCLPSPCWQPRPLHIPQKKNEEEGKIKCVLQPGSLLELSARGYLWSFTRFFLSLSIFSLLRTALFISQQSPPFAFPLLPPCLSLPQLLLPPLSCNLSHLLISPLSFISPALLSLSVSTVPRLSEYLLQC